MPKTKEPDTWSWEDYERLLNKQKRSKQYYKKNKEKVSTYGAKYYHENKEKCAMVNKKYREIYKERLNKINKKRNREAWKNFDDLFWFSRRCSAIKARAKNFNLDFDLDPEYLQSIFPKDGKCPALGISFRVGNRYAKGKQREKQISLDRIDSSKGYIKGNVQWVSLLANVIMTNATPDQVMAVAKHYKKITEEKNDAI